MQPDQFLTKYFTILIKPKLYSTLLYLFLTFPLGLTYFITLTIGISLGLGLLVIWIGLFILALLFPLIWLLINFERVQTIHLLGIDIPTSQAKQTEKPGLWEKFKAYLQDSSTWKGLFFVLLKFPIGLFSFTFLVTGLVLLFTMIFSPLIVPWISINFGFWKVDTFSEAIGLCILGIMLLPGLFHFYYYVGQAIGKFSALLLNSKG